MNLRLLTLSLLIPVCNFIIAAQTLTLQLSTEADDTGEKSEFGHRIPPRPITAIVDFDSRQIIFGCTADPIENYEIAGLNGDAVSETYETDSEFVQALGYYMATTQSITIRINCTNSSYIGTLEL